jgi:PadR family transcriptional regulator PadR
MWFGKFLDIKDEITGKAHHKGKALFKNIKKDKLTPLEFTILETIFNREEMSGYDLIYYLNEHFAGTWIAKSGTVYPILSKLKLQAFLKTRTVKSPIGPLKKLYYLSEAGKAIMTGKVHKNFDEQVKFMGNNLLELSSIFIHSFPEEERDVKIKEIQELIQETLEDVIEKIPRTVLFKEVCPKCKLEIDRKVSFCPHCGEPLRSEEAEDMKPAKELNT